MPDKIVFLKRSQPFVHDQISSDMMQEQLSMTKRSIGSYYASIHSTRLGSGCTPDEERFLIAKLNGWSESDKENSKALRDEIVKFYTDISTNIPGGATGLKLNIGLEDNGKPLIDPISKETNTPENVLDYIRWRHAIGYPNTAPSVESAEGNPLIEYFIEDPDKVLNSKYEDTEDKDKAIAQYIVIKGDPKKTEMVLNLMRSYVRKEKGKPPIDVKKLNAKEQIIVLRDLAMQRPEKFYAISTDENINKKYFLDECLSYGVLSRIGDSIVDVGDSNKPLGDTIESLVISLWNEKESMRLVRLKGARDAKKEKSKMLIG